MVTSDGIVDGNQINDKSGNLPRTRSKFTDSLSHVFPNTNRFGELSPFFVMEGVPSDSVKLLSSQKVDSYTLKAPLMQDIKLRKDLFVVPRQALLPINWDKFITNPTIGDDVPDDCGTCVSSFWTKVYSFISGWHQLIVAHYNALDSTDPDYELDYRAIVADAFRWMVVAEYFYSNGSLLASLNCHGRKFLDIAISSLNKSDFSLDQVFDILMSLASVHDLPISYDGYHLPVSADGSSIFADGVGMSWREFIDYLRDDPYFFAMNNPDDDSILVSDDFSGFLDTFVSLQFSFYASEDDDLDLARPESYQVVCHHFYSNDHVDYIYSADLYRQYIQHIFESFPGNSSDQHPRFSINGLYYEYDWLSAYIFDRFISAAIYYVDEDDDFHVFCQYLSAIFSYRHSLRFIDYFVGSKTRPLAIGDTDVQVNSNKASVVDITRNIQLQRFLNAVNRVGRKISDYTKMLVGVDMAPDFHNPLYVGSTQDVIFGDRSEYTGNVSDSEANNVTAVFKSSGGRYQFDFGCDRDAIVIGIQYYDIHRVYSESIDRHYFHKNRFDFFNPFMQFIGDQVVYQSELTKGGKSPFGYQTRHMEYKQFYDYCAGGFVENLPAWIFKAERGFRKYESNQSPKFIRSFPSEFDQFYVSLSGWSLGSYFHFIVENVNLLDASRPMAKTPDILQ